MNLMQDEFANRAGMHRTVIETLDQPTNVAVWKDQPPLAFTRKAAQLKEMVTALEAKTSEQSAVITGHAERKADEREDVRAMAHAIGQALAGYFEDAGRADQAAAVDRSPSELLRMRDEALLGHARQVQGHLADALAADAATLESDYAVTEATGTDFAREIDEYSGVIASPQTAVAARRALTKVLRPEFAKVSDLLKSMDRHLPAFRGTEAGIRFSNAWKSARITRDLGRGPAAPKVE